MCQVGDVDDSMTFGNDVAIYKTCLECENNTIL